jgi:hypothetical protein
MSGLQEKGHQFEELVTKKKKNKKKVKIRTRGVNPRV